MANEPYQPDLSNMERVEPAPGPPIAPPLPSNSPGWNGYQRSPLPPALNTSSDQLRQFYNKNMGPQMRVLPQQAAGIASSNAAARAQAINITESGLGLQLQTNGQTNATQSLLNLLAGPNITLSANALGGVTITGTAGGDGLTHGTTPWETDPGVVYLRDDFHPYLLSSIGQTTQANVGQLGWAAYGSAASVVYQTGGLSPNAGQYWFSNNTSTEVCAYLMLNSEGGASSIRTNCQALLEKPTWGMTFVWSLGPDVSSTGNFNTAKKSLYVGLTSMMIPVSGTSSRPDVFIGVRYDTSSGIADTNYTLEVVCNPTYTGRARNNTQGTTYVTNVAPSMATWHRLDITCTTAGKVTMTLDGSATNTLTATVPTITCTSTGGGECSVNNGAGRVYIAAGASSPDNYPTFAGGSSVTIAGLTGGNAPINGTRTLIFADDNTTCWFNATGSSNIGNNNASFTVVGYPALAPLFLFGNDSTASPAVDTMMGVDFWSFYWNALGSTPDPTKPRYF